MKEIFLRESKRLRRCYAVAGCVPVLQHARSVSGLIVDRIQRAIEAGSERSVARLDAEGEVRPRGIARLHELDKRAVFRFVVFELKGDELGTAVRKARDVVVGLDTRIGDCRGSDGRRRRDNGCRLRRYRARRWRCARGVRNGSGLRRGWCALLRRIQIRARLDQIREQLRSDRRPQP